MGVPGFVNWLVSRYPLIARRMNNASRPKFDLFFVDFNCIIHSAIRANKTIDEGSSEEEIIKELFHYLDTLVQVTRPSTLLFISVDGPAPFAKCQQQRIRRFSRDKKPDPTSTFSSNSISVGTEFMERLLHKLLDFIHERIENDINWSKPKVIYSSARTPGEGEHKFFDFFRAQKEAGKWNENASCCVYSPDADLIFVCLQSQIKNICILRENDPIFTEIKQKFSTNDSGIKYFANDFTLIYVNLIREYLCLDFESNDSRIFDDFAALSYLIGNDFIPHIPDISVERGEFSIIVDLYKNKFLKQNKFLVEGLSFNSNNLSEFLKQAALSIGKHKCPDLSETQLMSKAEEKLCQQMPAEYASNSEELKRSISHSVIDSFYWVLGYYKNGVPSWSWSYPYKSAPSLIIIAEYVIGYKPEFDIGAPPTPFEQLLCILPYQSKNLIPNTLQPLLEPNSPIGYLYPSDYKTILEVPEADLNLVKEAIKPLLPTLTPEEKERNTIIPPYLITNEKTTFVEEAQVVLDYTSNDKNVPCIPSLYFYDIKPTVVRYPSFEQKQMILTFSIPVQLSSAKMLLHHTILVDYPYFIPAIVNDVEYKKSFQFASQVDNDYLKYYGLDIKTTEVYITANVLQFADCHESNLIWSAEKFHFPLQLTVPIESTNVIERFRPIHIPPPFVNCLAFITDGKDAGSFGKITKINKRSFAIEKMDHPNPLPNIQKILQEDHQYWIPLTKVAKQYKLPMNIMISALSDIHTKNQINIAFTIFKSVSDQKSLKTAKGVEGFCTSIGNVIYLNQLVLEPLRQYFEKSEPLLSVLQNFKPDNGLTLNDVADQLCEQYGEERMMEIKQWVKENSPSRNFPFAKMYKSFHSFQTITTIENQLLNFTNQNTQNSETVTVDEKFVLYKGQLVNFNGKRQLSIGCRVVTLNFAGIVPFGTYGTVISLSFNKRLAHIIADDEFEYGNKMRGYLKTNRGFVMESSDLYILH